MGEEKIHEKVLGPGTSLELIQEHSLGLQPKGRDQMR